MTGVPSSITDLSTTATSNSPAGSDAVGGNTDNYFRAIQAILRAESENKSWERWNDTPTRTGATTFTVATDLTARYVVGRRLKCTDSSTLYGTIASSSFGAGVTTVTVTLDSGSLSASLTEVMLGPDTNAFVAPTNPPFLDTNALIKGSSDTTKLVRFEVDGLTTGTTRVITVPDANITLAGLASPAFTGSPTAPTQTAADNSTKLATTAYVDAASVSAASTAETQAGTSTTKAVTPAGLLNGVGISTFAASGDLTLPASATTTWAHGLGRAPVFCELFLHNTTTEGAWNGEIISASGMAANGGSQFGLSWYADTANVYVIGCAAQIVPNKSTGALVTITNSSWRLRIKAWG